MHRARVLLFVLLLVAALPTEAAGKPVIAVFTVELRSSNPLLSSVLTQYLASRLDETGRFAVVPQARLQRAIAAKRLESYRRCYLRSCQIEIGREVAATLGLTTQVQRIGTRCIVMSILYDMRTAISNTAATERGGCSEAALFRLLDAVAGKLAHEARDRSRAAPRRTTAAELLLLGSPDAARVVVTAAGKGRRECALPCYLRSISSATYTIEVSAPGFVSERRTVVVSLGRVVALSLDLKAVVAATRPADAPTAASSPVPARPPRPELQSAMLTPATRARHQIPPRVSFGVVVERVAAGSRAARQGVRVGDVILEVNGRKIETPAQLRRALGAARRVEILLHRTGRSLIIKL